MTSDIQIAAYLLLQSLDAPRGLVSVLAWPDDMQSRIRVFIDPAAKHTIPTVPTVFAGFPVEVELRRPLLTVDGVAETDLTVAGGSAYCS
jgi:hypothetical protein